jgi:hypothetical protein
VGLLGNFYHSRMGVGVGLYLGFFLGRRMMGMRMGIIIYRLGFVILFFCSMREKFSSLRYLIVLVREY